MPMRLLPSGLAGGRFPRLPGQPTCSGGGLAVPQRLSRLGDETCPVSILALGTILGLHRERSPSPSIRHCRGRSSWCRGCRGHRAGCRALTRGAQQEAWASEADAVGIPAGGGAAGELGGHRPQWAWEPGAPPAPWLWQGRPPLPGGLGAARACCVGLGSLGWVAPRGVWEPWFCRGLGGTWLQQPVRLAPRCQPVHPAGRQGHAGSPGAGLGPGLFQLSPCSPRASAWALGSQASGSVCCPSPEWCPASPLL